MQKLVSPLHRAAAEGMEQGRKLMQQMFPAPGLSDAIAAQVAAMSGGGPEADGFDCRQFIHHTKHNRGGDGIARAYGLDEVQAGEMVEFDDGTRGSPP